MDSKSFSLQEETVSTRPTVSRSRTSRCFPPAPGPILKPTKSVLARLLPRTRARRALGDPSARCCSSKAAQEQVEHEVTTQSITLPTSNTDRLPPSANASSATTRRRSLRFPTYNRPLRITTPRHCIKDGVARAKTGSSVKDERGGTAEANEAALAYVAGELRTLQGAIGRASN